MAFDEEGQATSCEDKVRVGLNPGHLFGWAGSGLGGVRSDWEDPNSAPCFNEVVIIPPLIVLAQSSLRRRRAKRRALRRCAFPCACTTS